MLRAPGALTYDSSLSQLQARIKPFTPYATQVEVSHGGARALGASSYDRYDDRRGGSDRGGSDRGGSDRYYERDRDRDRDRDRCCL